MKWSKSIARQYIATFSCFMCSMMTAVCFVWYTPLMVWLLEPDNDEIKGLDNDQLSWLIAIIEVGELLGPVPCGYIADRWGRKFALLLTFPMVMTSWIIHALTRDIVYLFAARIFQGMSIGFFFTAGPSYIAEISQPNMRGELCGHLQTMWFLGVLYAYSTGPFLSYQNYIYVSAIPAVLFFATFVFMPESPYLLLMMGNRNGAISSLKWLRGNENVEDEYESMSETVEKDKTASKGGWKDLIVLCKKPLMVITIFGVVKYLGGTGTIPQFITHTIASGSGLEIPADYISIVMGIVLLAVAVLAAFLADRLGRKPLVIWSTLLVAVSSLILAVYYYFERETQYDTAGLDWISYIGFVIYCAGFNIGLGPIQTTLQAEYFPSNLRSAAGAYCNILRNVLLFASIKQYQLFDDYFGVYTNFTFFAIISFVGLFILQRYMEETANKSLGEIRKDKEDMEVSSNTREVVITAIR